jgi:hypothetical protein
MKTINKITLALILLTSLNWGCTKEDPIKPSAQFTINLQDNTCYAGENFTIFTQAVKGDFYTIFPGDKPTTIYDPANPKARGVSITEMGDSMQYSYPTAGTYTFTMVVTSTGNWAEDFLMDTKSVTITVIDRRAELSRITIDKIDGKFSEDHTEIYFYSVKTADISAKAPIFFATSKAATVYVGDVLQVSGTSTVDFSVLHAGDPEGRPVVYTVKAANGESKSYTVKYILRDPYTEKVLNSITFSSLGKTFYPNEAAKTFELLYPASTAINALKAKASASIGATVNVGTKAIQDKETACDFNAATKITVKAEDGTSQDYTLVKTAIEEIKTFSFTKSNGVALSPAPLGVIDLVAKTITVKVLPGTNKTKLVASFTGLTTYSAQVGATVLLSGTSELSYSSPVVIDVMKGGVKYDSYTVTVLDAAK